jgi:hypothetical protein
VRTAIFSLRFLGSPAGKKWRLVFVLEFLFLFVQAKRKRKGNAVGKNKLAFVLDFFAYSTHCLAQLCTTQLPSSRKKVRQKSLLDTRWLSVPKSKSTYRASVIFFSRQEIESNSKCFFFIKQKEKIEIAFGYSAAERAEVKKYHSKQGNVISGYLKTVLN